VGKYAPEAFRFAPEGNKYAAVTRQLPDGSVQLVAKRGLFASAGPARSGDTVTLWASGLGPTSPAVPSATLFSGVALVDLSANIRVRVGVRVSQILFVGRVASGLDQINFVVPDLPDGDHQLYVDAGGVISPAAMLTVTNNPD
jgi:uncharacterized protein (TIGR03437 family)